MLGSVINYRIQDLQELNVKPKRPKVPVVRNPVAKHAIRLCKPATHRNKKHDYQRTPKHRSQDFGVFCGRRWGGRRSRRVTRLGVNC